MTAGPAAPALLCDNDSVMRSLMLALSDPGSITPRAPLESLTSWQRRAIIEHAAPFIIATARPGEINGHSPTTALRLACEGLERICQGTADEADSSSIAEKALFAAIGLAEVSSIGGDQ